MVFSLLQVRLECFTVRAIGSRDIPLGILTNLNSAEKKLGETWEHWGFTLCDFGPVIGGKARQTTELQTRKLTYFIIELSWEPQDELSFIMY